MFHGKVLQIVFALLLVCSANLHGKDSILVLTKKQLANQASGIFFVEQFSGYKYRTQDKPEFSNPNYDDSDWQLTRSFMYFDSIQKEHWTGIAWFRLRIKIDSTLVGEPLSLSIHHRGASELFLDGKKIGGYGAVSINPESEVCFRPNEEHLPIYFTDTLVHHIAVRYSDTKAWARAARKLNRSRAVGVTLAFSTIQQRTSYLLTRRSQTSVSFLLIGSLAALTILHFLLYVFTRSKEHLLYALFVINILLFFAVRAAEALMQSYVEIVLWFNFAGLYFLIFAFIICTIFFYYVFYPKMPKLVWGVVFLPLSILTFGSLNSRFTTDIPFYVTVGGVFTEIIRVIIVAMVRKKDGAWVLGLGGLIFVVLLGTVILLESLQIPLPVDGFWFIFPAMVSIPFAMSVYISRKVARTNKHLSEKLMEVQQLTDKTIEQEVHRKVLEVDNARKTLELEEARKLQLAMLPQTMPDIHELDISMYMQTATEVGGDYYDYFLEQDGTLTIAIGDATGHGVKAGTMVAATKSLLTMMSHELNESSSAGVLIPSSPALKRMNLRSMFMALTIVKLKKQADGCFSAIVANAGMPSALVYRANNGTIEELLLKSMPLGTMPNFPYQDKHINLCTGDVLLLMSDGFPERFNQNEDILGYDIAQQKCIGITGKNSEQIVEYLVQCADEWAEGAPLNDDMTFVVVKIK